VHSLRPSSVPSGVHHSAAATSGTQLQSGVALSIHFKHNTHLLSVGATNMLSFSKFTRPDNPHRAANSAVISHFKITSFLLVTIPFVVYYIAWNYIFHDEPDHAWKTTACGIASFVSVQFVVVPYVISAFLEPLDDEGKKKQKCM
jgi:hypothetical protein